jgi:hypothetical protein
MYNQFFSGDTATQTTGTIPVVITPKIAYNYYLNKALGKDVSEYTESMQDYDKNKNIKKSILNEPLLDIEPEVTSEKESEPEVPGVPLRILKKHNFNIYPEMDNEDYLALKNDIQKNGYDPKYPIWLYNGKILDGWNRQRACTELNVSPSYIDFIGNDSDAITFVVRSNNRRNLTPSQRACMATDYESLFEQFKTEAKSRQIEGGKNKVRQKIAEPKRDDNKTDSKVAKLFDTNRTYIQKARKTKVENPNLFEKIKSGEVTFSNISKHESPLEENELPIPKEYVDKVNLVLGNSDIDLATSNEVQETDQATTCFTIITNQLDKDWTGDVFINPPYSNTEVSAFIDKFIVEYNSGHITQGIILTNNSTNEDWFHRLMKIVQLACFTYGRLKSCHKRKTADITHGQVFFYIGNDEKKFIETFTELGLILRKA